MSLMFTTNKFSNIVQVREILLLHLLARKVNIGDGRANQCERALPEPLAVSTNSHLHCLSDLKAALMDITECIYF